MDAPKQIPTLSEMLRKELDLVDSKMQALLAADFGVEPTNHCLRDWHQLAWDQFETRLPKTEPQTEGHHGYVHDWREFFHTEKNRRARAEALYAQLERK